MLEEQFGSTPQEPLPTGGGSDARRRSSRKTGDTQPSVSAREKRNEEKAANAALKAAEGVPQRRPLPTGNDNNGEGGAQQPPVEEVRDVKSAFARGDFENKTGTNSTGVRGLDSLLSPEELHAELQKRDEKTFTEEEQKLAPLLAHLSKRLLEYRSDIVHSYRVRVVLTLRCFLEVIKLLLRYDEKGRALWYSKKDVRVELAKLFASYMAAQGTMILDIAACPEALQFAFWGALQYVSRTFADAVEGWQNVSGATLPPVPQHFNEQWRSANVDAIVENDELVTDKQGSKLVDAFMAVVTSDNEFHGLAEQQFKRNPGACRTMLSYIVGRDVARFPSKTKGDEDDDGDDDDELENTRREKR